MNSWIFLFLDEPEQLWVHRDRVLEEILNGAVVGNGATAARVWLHPIHENLNLQLFQGIKFLYHRLARPIAEKYKLVVLIFVRQFAVYLWLNPNFIDWTFSSHKQKQWLARLKIQTCVFKVMTNSSKSFSAEGFGERLNTEDILLLNRKTSSN